MKTLVWGEAALGALAFLSGCAPTLSETPMRPMVPYVEKAKTQGPKLTQPELLEAWLTDAGDAVLRLPITVERGPYGQRLGAKLGARELLIDDSALGVALSERLRSACGEQNPCRVWVEGRWRNGTLQVLHFSRAVAPGEAADFVEREP